VVCDGIEVAYGGVIAVDDVSFDVHAGEVFGLLVPNGEGKTSVIRALSTIIDVSGGSATIAGYPLTEPARVRSVIGVLPESNGYPGSVSEYDYLVYFGRLSGQSTSAANARSAELLVDVGLQHVADNLIRTFSRGMRQRLEIARALINRPQVLFLDEPTLGLDPAGRKDVLETPISQPWMTTPGSIGTVPIRSASPVAGRWRQFSVSRPISCSHRKRMRTINQTRQNQRRRTHRERPPPIHRTLKR
jgi:ABC-type multidrug transport system ATPase subunit